MRNTLLALAFLSGPALTMAASAESGKSPCFQVVSIEGKGGIVIGNQDGFLSVRDVRGKIIPIRYDSVISSKWIPCPTD
jgi:hypothetical protein